MQIFSTQEKLLSEREQRDEADFNIYKISFITFTGHF